MIKNPPVPQKTKSEVVQIGGKQLTRSTSRIAKNIAFTNHVCKHEVIKTITAKLTRGPGIGYQTEEQTSQWPDGIITRSLWNPKRFYGPFSEENFSQIEIRIQGQNAGLYFNNYFNGHPDASKYNLFFPSRTLPTRVTPVLNLIPGFMPSNDGAGQFICYLNKIEFSSKYGGCIKLVFYAKSDTGIEVRRTPYLWDLKNLELHFYITPTKEGLQTPQRMIAGNTICEVVWDNQICMELSQPASILKVLEDNHLPELKQITEVIQKNIGQLLNPDLRRFTGGFLWSLFPDLLGSGIIVDEIDLSDHLIDLKTHQGIPMILIQFSVHDPISYGNSINDWRLTLWSEYRYCGILQKRAPVTYNLIQTENNHHRARNRPTPWFTAGIWRQDEMNCVSDIKISFSGVEVDFGHDDVFGTYSICLDNKLDSNALNDAETNNSLGPIQQIYLNNVYVWFPESDWMFTFSVYITVLRVLR